MRLHRTVLQIMELWEEQYGARYGEGIPEKDFQRILTDLKGKAEKISVDNNTPYTKLRTSMVSCIAKVNLVPCLVSSPWIKIPKERV